MLHKAGAVFYGLWAALHLLAALDGFRLAGSEVGLVSGKLMQNSWNLAAISVLAGYIAWKMNWRNDKHGYWYNLVLISVADIGFVLFILLPGHIAMWPGALGPLLWLMGAFFTTLAYRQAHMKS